MKSMGRGGVPARGRFSVALVAILALSVVPRCLGQQPGDLLDNRLRLPKEDKIEAEKIEDELVAEGVAGERLKESRNRAFGAGYLAVAPKIMCAGGREKVFITFVNFTQPIEVMVTVTQDDDKTLATAPARIFKTPCGCMELELPRIDQARQIVVLTLYARRTLMNCKEFEITDKVKVYLDACNSETFIETDKPIYKAGQRVQFRVLTLQSDLRPDMSEVSKIWIESPSGIHMAQWLDVAGEEGLIDLSLPLSKDPPLGEWTVKVMHHNRQFDQKFQVGEYVLPKFEVLIEAPDFVVVPGSEEEFTVCGRYTHGQPVKGSIRIFVSTSLNPEAKQEKAVKAADSTGCHTFIIDLKELDVTAFNGNTLIVTAEIEEAATHVLIKKTKADIKISQWPFELEFSVPSTFKPGLPFSGMLLIKDPSGKPLAAEVAEVVATSQHPEELLREVVISNEKGMVFFSIESMAGDEEFITLLAAGGQDLGKGPRSRVQLEPQYSPSKSFLHIQPVIESATVHSFQTLTINMVSEMPDYEGAHLNIVLMSRGNILEGVDIIIPPEEIDGFRRPGEYGVYPIKTDKMGMKEYSYSLNMRSSDVPIHMLRKGRVTTTHLRFKVSYEMSPAVTVMVYYIMKSGEVVADTVSVPVEEVFQNKVSMKFADSQKQPGEMTALNVLAKPSSLCAYGAVDKSVYLLGDDNRITKKKVFRALEELQLSAEGGFAELHSKRCEGAGGYGRPLPFFEGLARQMPMSANTMPDASQSFKDLGVVYLTNLQVETAPCPEVFPVFVRRGGVMDGQIAQAGPMPFVAMMAESVDMVQAEVALTEAESPGPDIRSYFPETWLYSLVRVSSDGEAEVPVVVPHSITEWIGHGFCTSAHFGAGVSELTKLTIFQPFFIDLSLLSSVVRYERVPVTATVFNYVAKCLVVEVTLKSSKDFKIEDKNRVETVCVCGSESKAVVFYIQPLVLGNIAINVNAISVTNRDKWCVNSQMQIDSIGFEDAIMKPLLVKPEGVEEEQVVSTYFCPSDYPKGIYVENIALRDLPENYVSGSEQATVTVTGNVLGPTLGNLDSLLRIPTGCGEQNMIGFVPNIMVLHYLKGINHLDSDVEAKAKENMMMGYQRQLTYRRTDASYSAFGMSDQEGSTWLTAFVVRAFSQAARHIYVDKDSLGQTMDWLTAQQSSETGCFLNRGRVIHKDMMGNVNDATTLTAYVVISLIEAGTKTDAKNIQRAIGCLEKKIDITSADMYTLAIAGYAFILAGHPHTDDVLSRLEELAIVSDDNLKHWEGRPEPVVDRRPAYLHHQASSQHIEVTAYVLLAYLRAYSKTKAMLFGRPVSSWLTAQRNAQGGFASTQDTVVALQALSEYGLMAYVQGSQDVQVRVHFSCEKDPHWLYVMEHNRLLLQSLPVPQVPVEIRMNATGPGCVMTQVITKYNVHPLVPAQPPFKLDVSSSVNSNSFPICSGFFLSVCTTYQGPDKVSNMAVVEVGMVSGYEADENSLDKLRASKGPRSPKRVDNDGSRVNLYFDQFDGEKTCVEIPLNRASIVQKPRDGFITVFDYYERALTVTSAYNLECDLQK